jgi:hypothetical protein
LKLAIMLCVVLAANCYAGSYNANWYNSYTDAILIYVTATGTNYDDSSTNNNDGNFGPSIDVVKRDGAVSDAIHFDNTTNAFLRINPSATVNMIGSNTTICFWRKGVTAAPLRYLFHNKAFDGAYGLYIYGYNTGTIDAQCDGAGYWRYTNIAVNASSVWEHIAFVFSGTNVFAYLDGTLLTQREAKSGGATKATRTTNTFYFAYGAGEVFSGTLSDYIIIPRALTGSEITNLVYVSGTNYVGSSVLPNNGPLLWWNALQ